MKVGKGNGQEGPPIVGGVDLSALKRAVPPPRTQHKTVFQSCKLITEVIVDDDHLVTGYKFKILDILENHVYEFNFASDTKNAIRDELASWPDERFPFREEEEQE